MSVAVIVGILAGLDIGNYYTARVILVIALGADLLLYVKGKLK